MDQTTRNTSDRTRAALLAVIGAALVGATVAGARAVTAPDRPRPADSAPGRTARRHRFGNRAVTGRTVTIDRPRADVYAFWRHAPNLPRFMSDLDSVDMNGDIARWTLRAAGGRNLVIDTRVVEDRTDELISWRSVEGSDITTEGKVILRDAPAGRGTVITAIVSWVPPGGEIGQRLARLWGDDPETRTRHDLKRLKMLLETGEIATARNRPAA